MREKLSIALKLKIIPNTLGCYRLSALYPAPPNFRMKHGTQAVGNATFEVYSDRSSGQIGCHSKQIRSAASARCRRPRLLGFRGLLSIKQSSFKKKKWTLWMEASWRGEHLRAHRTHLWRPPSPSSKNGPDLLGRFLTTRWNCEWRRHDGCRRGCATTTDNLNCATTLWMGNSFGRQS